MGHFCNPKFFFDYAAGFSLSGTSGKFLAGDWQFVVSAWVVAPVSAEGLSHHILYSMELLLTLLGILFVAAGTNVKAGMFIRGLQ